jgi:hypothetical protein
MRKALFYGAALIGGYLVLVNFKGFTSDITSAGAGSVNLVKAFQGR